MMFPRISAIIVEHFLRLFHSVAEIIDTFYWSVMDVVIWGFMTNYLNNFGGTGTNVIAFLLSALILWNISWRSQQDISVSLLWDAWNNNLTNLFATPLSVWEFLTGVLLLGAVKIFLTLTIVLLVAFFAFNFNLFNLGLYLLPFFGNLLMFGWVVGIFITALIIRFGREIQDFAWGVMILINPVAAVFYPVSVLPHWLQIVAKMLPPSYIFEGMRSVLNGNYEIGNNIIMAFLLNCFYLILSLLFFSYMFEQAREKGRLVKLEQ